MKEYTTPEIEMINTHADVITTSAGDTPTVDFGW